MPSKNTIDGLALALANHFNLNKKEVANVINCYFNTLAPPVVKEKPLLKRELIQIATDLGLKIPSKWNKPEIQAAIDAKLKQNASTNQSLNKKQTSNQQNSTSKLIPIPIKEKKCGKKSTVVVKSLTGAVFTEKNKKPNKTWEFGNLIGTGGYGAVYEEKNNPQLVIKTGNYKRQEDNSGIYYERSILSRLQKGKKYGIPEIIAYGKLPINIKKDYYLVLPRYENSLETICVNFSLSIENINSVMIQMLNAIDFIHTEDILHLDIKPDNIMKKGNRWYLIDFGLAKRYKLQDENCINQDMIKHGTPWYMARDAHIGLISRKCDLESLVYTLATMNKTILSWQKNWGKIDRKIISDLILCEKNKFFNSINTLNFPENFKRFITLVNLLVPGIAPDYKKMISFFN